MSYKRVVPRDLFNESMLLKCLGRMSVDILDGKFIKYRMDDKLLNPTFGFEIEQNPYDGSIFCENYQVTVESQVGKLFLRLFTPLNSRTNYPLICESIFDSELINVFHEDGKYTKEFFNHLKELNDFEG